jgi:hypothetical protein
MEVTTRAAHPMPLLRFTLAEIEDVALRADALQLSPRARERLAWLRHHALTGSVAETCRLFGIPRVTLYRLLTRFDPRDPTSLEDRSRRPHTVRTVVTPDVLARIRRYREHEPALSCQRLSEALATEHGIRVSPASIHRALARAGTVSETTSPDRPGGPIIPPATETDPSAECTGPRPDRAVWRWRALAVGSVLVSVLIAGLLVVGAAGGGGPWW